jgi:hypothetical protein
MPPRMEIDLRSLTVRDLLRLSARVVTELKTRGVVRSRNAPAGDLAEYLVFRAYQGELAAPSGKSWDVQAGTHKLQVKCRLVDPDDRRSQTFSLFRSWEFNACVFVVFDCYTYDIIRAVEIPMETVKNLARESSWVKAHRISVSQIIGSVKGARDVTDLISSALDDLGE